MTRSNFRTQSLALVLFLALFASAQPALAWGYDHGDRHDDDQDRNPSCWIKARPNTTNHYGGEVTFSWESRDADWAEITDIGVVPTDGSLKVSVYTSKTYRMIVHADDRTAECDTFVNIIGEVPKGSYGNYSYQYQYQYPYPAYQVPYVALTQIPYTGFDFGPLGNAIYWMMLIGMAIVAAYLLVYQAGLRAIASVPVIDDVVRAGRMQYRAVRTVLSQMNAPEAASVPVVADSAEAQQRSGDTMQIVEGEAPRIIISRE